ncbi:MAG: MBG domain-containing protein [Acidimicrobiales bacterium]|jgi:alpha-tubulin suppressor-like RCC1 family protein
MRVLTLVLVVTGVAVGVVAAVHPGRTSTAHSSRHRSGAELESGSALPSRELYGWGDNDSGQVGVGSVGGGTETGVALPTAVDAPAGVSFSSVAAGGSFTVGLATSGRVYSWGSNGVGQLGDGSTTGATTPVTVDLPSGTFTAVAAGSGHSLALTSGGEVFAWGANLFGQLGDGTTQATETPVAVAAPAGVTFTAVAAGGDHSLALSSTGTVYAWGANSHGQLGDGSTTSVDAPVVVATPAGVTFTAIAAGTGHSLALASDGQVYAWGFDASGQLGDGTDVDSLTPVEVSIPSGTTISSIAAGGSHSLALSDTGLVFAWGSDVFGQLASSLVGSLPVDSDVPVQPTGLPPTTSFVSITAGQYTSYALTSIGVAWVWGGDFYGQLGDGTPGINAVPPASMASLPPGTLATGLFAGPDATSAFLVTRADQTVTFPTLPSPTYGDPPVDVAPTASSGLAVSGTTSGSCTGSLEHLYLVGAGTCSLAATQVGSFAYYPATATATFPVAPAVLEVVPDPATGTVGASLPPFGYHLTGFDNGDTQSVVSGSAACTTSANPSSFRGSYAITCTVGTLRAANYVFVAGPPGTLTLVGPSTGYAVLGSDGSITPVGPVPAVDGVEKSFFGSMAGQSLDAPVVGAAYTPFHDGYWMVATDGGIFAFGAARFEGSMGGRPLNQPIVGMAATPDGGGYWEVAADGGIFAFGDAGFYGSTGNLDLVQPIVGMAATVDGRGYWLVAADGGVFAFGDAGFHGSTGGRPSADPVVGIAATSDGDGYWMVTRAGAVFPFGDATYEGSLRYVDLNAPIVGITPSADGQGYWLAGSDGGVFAFGDAPFYGSVTEPPMPIVGII